MPTSLLDVLAVRHGHFHYESGHHGDLWLDLDALFTDPMDTCEWVRSLAGSVSAWAVEVVCGPLTGGAFAAQLLAVELGARFVYAERHRAAGDGVAYRVPAGQRPLLAGRRTLVVDDAINAGSAVSHTLVDLDACGALPAGIACLLSLGPAGAAIAAQRGIPFVSLASLSRTMWPAATCPLCSQGVALDSLD